MSIKSLASKRAGIVKDLENVLGQAVKLKAELDRTDIAMYQLLEKPDCLLNDSPLSPTRSQNNVRRYLAKLGWRWAHSITDGAEAVRTLTEECKDAPKWAMRFSPEGVDKLV